MNLVDDNTQKRISAKDRLGPAVSYVDYLRVLATQHQTNNGKPLTLQIPILKVSKSSEITQTKDNVNVNEEGKATLQAKFLGITPY
jgi:hypothetical protein